MLRLVVLMAVFIALGSVEVMSKTKFVANVGTKNTPPVNCLIIK